MSVFQGASARPTAAPAAAATPLLQREAGYHGFVMLRIAFAYDR